MSEAYYPHLHALRALAVADPVVMHLWPTSVPDSPVTARLTGIGALGVDLFFVISGFLITGILLDARARVAQGTGTLRQALVAFYLRRTLRIFPVYWLLLLALAAAGVAGVRENIGWEFTYLTNVLIAARRDWLATGEGHFWSLAVEEQFYLIWPIVLLLLPRRALLPCILGVIVAAPLFRWYAVRELSLFHAAVLTPSCMDALGLGALLALARRERRTGPGLYRALLGCAAIAGGAGTLLHLGRYIQADASWIIAEPLARTSYALLFTLLVARAADGFTGIARRLAELRAVVYLGTISYAVYLFHPLIGQLPILGRLLLPLATEHPIVYFMVQAGLTVAAAAASWHGLEKPINALRRRVPYASAPAPIRARAPSG